GPAPPAVGRPRGRAPCPPAMGNSGEDRPRAHGAGRAARSWMGRHRRVFARAGHRMEPVALAGGRRMIHARLIALTAVLAASAACVPYSATSGVTEELFAPLHRRDLPAFEQQIALREQAGIADG